MSEHHPRREALEELLLSRLPAAEAKAAVGHLLGGCERCQEDLSPLATAMFTPDAAQDPHLSQPEEDAYDRAISAAFDKALQRAREPTPPRETARRKGEEIVRALRRAETPALP